MMHLVLWTVIIGLSIIKISVQRDNLNIHLPLMLMDTAKDDQSKLYRFAVGANKALQKYQHQHKQQGQQKNGEKIDFGAKHNPHVTLYMAMFDRSKRKDLLRTLERVVSEHRGPIQITIPFPSNPTVAGPYAMYDNPMTPALQSLCDDIVQAVRPYLHPSGNNDMPPWVKTVQPAEKRDRKMRYMEQYHSPNVLDEYDSHVTVGYDTTSTTKERLATLERYYNDQSEEVVTDGSNSNSSNDDDVNNNVENTISMRIRHVAIGKVGVAGTVLKGGILRAFALSKKD